MRILFIPIVSSERVFYKFNKDTFTATMDGVTDTFDFSNFPDGVLNMYNDKGNPTVETNLETNPIISAKRENGVLWVELLNFISTDATEEERFPKWIDAKDYKAGETNG